MSGGSDAGADGGPAGWRPEPVAASSPRFLFTAALLLALGLLPLLAGALDQPFLLTLVSRVMIYAIAAASLNLLVGYTGLVSLGHAMYLSVGAYAVAILGFHGVVDGWLQLAGALVAAALLAGVTGLVSLRTSGMAFIMITLAFAQMFLYLVVSIRQYGGDDGLRLAGRSSLPPFNLDSPQQFYWLVLGLLLATLYGSWRLVHSRYGLALRGIRSNERRMRGLGFAVARLKLSVMVLAGCLTALAGFLLANLTAYASPAYGGWNVSGDLLVMVIAGGLGTIVGPLVGALALLLSEEALSSLSSGWVADHWMFAIGLAILLLAVTARRGLYGGLRQWSLRREAGPGSVVDGQAGPAPVNDEAIESVLSTLPGLHGTTRLAPSDITALQITHLNKRFGGLTATDNLSLTIAPDELHALIGPNGAGKTTLIGQLCGELAPDGGTIELAGTAVTRWQVERRARAGLARCYQITQVCADLPALANVTLALLAGQRGAAWSCWQPVAADGALCGRALALLDAVGLRAHANDEAGQLAHGQQRQLELAMALARQPRLLLLDEPLAGMSGAESLTMVALLRRLKGRVPMLLVEHDMDAVFALADRITVLVNGRAIASGTPAQVRSDPEVRRAYLGEDDA